MIPGAVLAAVGWSVLKVAGASYVGNQIVGADALYGTLGGVVALLLLFYLPGRLSLYGAEPSAVLVERRSGPLQAAEDRETPAAATRRRVTCRWPAAQYPHRILGEA